MSAGPLWTVAEMAAAMGAERQGVLPSAISGISIDSRSIAPGEAFFALADRRDGHEFVDAALMAKAGLAVIAAERRGQFPPDAPLLLVRDVLPALRDRTLKYGRHTEPHEHRKEAKSKKTKDKNKIARLVEVFNGNACDHNATKRCDSEPLSLCRI